jgi:DNA-binding XRE family transcriptional regulator
VIEIKHQVKQFREESKMSKAALARKIGAVRSYVTKLENEEIRFFRKVGVWDKDLVV